MRPWFVPFLLFIAPCASYKFLCYAPLFGRSHINFLGQISDVLTDAGHEVVMLISVVDSKIDVYKPRNANRTRVILVDQSEIAAEMDRGMEKAGGFSTNSWQATGAMSMLSMFGNMTTGFIAQCRHLLTSKKLLDELRAEKFDAAYSEVLDMCAAPLWDQLGIKNFAITQSMTIMEGAYEIHGMVTVPSYVPGSMSSSSDRMTFFERMVNFVTYSAMRTIGRRIFVTGYVKMFEEIFPNKYTDFLEMYAHASLIFLNAEPLIEFPRPTSHKVVDIGGIQTSSHKKLNKEWSDILSLRPKTVLISFGTVAKSYLMPKEYKETIRQTIKRFTDVTFIWKYEKPEDNIGDGIANLLVKEWVPQNDMLHDDRLTLFITHCGAGSTMEATIAGVPLVVIPVMGDQRRNAQVVKRTGTGVILEKSQLEKANDLENAIREVLDNESYRKTAKRTARMIASRPFSPRELFVRNMEFLTEFGPLDNLQHYGRHLNFFQFYSLDVIAFLSAVLAIIVTFTFLTIRCICRRLCCRAGQAKSKKD